MKKYLIALMLLQAGLALADDAVILKLTSTDGVLEPLTLEAPAGKAITLVIINAGKSAMEFESKPLKIEKVVAAGKTKEIKIQALAAGSYKFVDEFHETQPSAQGTLLIK
ncbi:cupredoxin domain-containing protein [Iodobacter sp.]|uniref:cupredoxin domain-containing protein n=1 Tax=Iodobacter sp. TaxID=1915058 RepID=UPI0025EE553B|nr:cupredoxin domain-containing protein [Iodobacter sp.]